VVNVYRVYAISMIYALWMLRNKLFYLYLTVLLPFTILVPFLIIAPARLGPFIAVGTVILTLIYCFSTASQDLAADRLLKRMAIILTKPVTPLEYFLGILLSNAMQTLPATVIVTMALWIVGLIKIENMTLLLLGLVAGWYILTIMGYITALTLLSRDYNTIIIASNSIAFILTFMAPVYYRLSLEGVCWCFKVFCGALQGLPPRPQGSSDHCGVMGGCRAQRHGAPIYLQPA